MRREGHDVFAAILEQHLPPQSLVAPGFTIVDGPLAQQYGFTDVDPSSGPVRVETAERGGLFTQGHFLTAGTGSEFKRVIHRGLYALTRTLCTSVPMLDPATLEEIQESQGNIDPSLPLGTRMQMHRSSSERCIACHGLMDPLGLSLEHFDADGKWRDDYADGSPIFNDFDFEGTSVADPAELEAFISGSLEYRYCVAEKLFTFGLHRAPSDDETCAIVELMGDEAAPRPLDDIAVDAFMSSLALTEVP
jgi:hypothetical protein